MTDKFDEAGFWTKLKKFAKKAGSEVVEKALWLFYASQESETPIWAKTAIYAALAYFILPVDAVPDVIPVAGFTDDLGVLAAAVASVSMYITSDVKEKANQKMKDWFG